MTLLLVSMTLLLVALPALAHAVHFACPACGSDLLPVTGGLRCVNNHLTNIAKEGHIHLLPPAKVNKQEQAASDGIVRAERAFYELGGLSLIHI